MRDFACSPLPADGVDEGANLYHRNHSLDISVRKGVMFKSSPGDMVNKPQEYLKNGKHAELLKTRCGVGIGCIDRV